MRKFLFVASVIAMTACSSANTEQVAADSTAVTVTADTVKAVVDTTATDSTSK